MAVTAAEIRARTCAYHRCGGAPVMVARVLSGDGDEMHETDNPLCPAHLRQVLDTWVGELVDGGPVQRITLTRPGGACVTAPPSSTSIEISDGEAFDIAVSLLLELGDKGVLRRSAHSTRQIITAVARRLEALRPVSE